MGRATITGGGTDGLYTISVDYGEDERTALVATLTARQTALASQITAATTAQSTATSARLTALADLDSAIGTWNASDQEDEDKKALATAQATLAAAEDDLRKANNRLARLQLTKSNVDARIVELSALVLTENKSAWCADYTQLGTGEVATLDIGEKKTTTVIAPGARPPQAADGQFRHSAVQSSAQLYWNLAVTPGREKWLPTYRVGVITALNIDLNTCTVNLDSVASDQQSLDINQAEPITDVPIFYMTCHAAVFAINDRVIVQFTGQNWNNPRVIGFESNPQPCEAKRLCFLVQIFENSPIKNAAGSTHWGYATDTADLYPDVWLNFGGLSASIRAAQQSDFWSTAILVDYPNWPDLEPSKTGQAVPPMRYNYSQRIRFDIAWYQDTGVDEKFYAQENTGDYVIQTYVDNVVLSPVGGAAISHLQFGIEIKDYTDEGILQDENEGDPKTDFPIFSGTEYRQYTGPDTAYSPPGPIYGTPVSRDRQAISDFLTTYWDSPPATINVWINGGWVEYTFETIGIRPDYFEDITENVSVPVMSPDSHTSAYNVYPGLMMCVIYRQTDYGAT